MKTRLVLPTLLVFAAALLAFITTTALALTVPVAQDTSSSTKGLLTSKSGEATSLTVANNQTALLDFDLSNLDVVPAAFDPSNIKSVLLELYVVKTNTAANLSVLMVTGTWSEIFKAKSEPLPAIDSTNVLATIPVPAAPNKQYVSVDITGAAVAALQSATNLNIAIETSTPGAKVTLGSKDGPAIGYPAVLDIEAGLGESAGPAGPANTLTIGTVASGTAPAISLTGSSPNQVLNITLAQGPMGPAGPANALTIGTVTGGTSTAVTITGTAPNQTLNFAIPNGQLPDYNIAIGAGALLEGGSGGSNVVIGDSALSLNQTGYNNTVVGDFAFPQNNSGNFNVVLGYQAGENNLSGSDNIYLGNVDANGISSGGSNESNTIRIGDPDQHTAAYIAGIYGQSSTDPTATLVYVDQTGHLVTSSTAPLNLPAGSVPATAIAPPPPGMVLIPAGSFTMGNVVGSGSDSDITNASPVTVTVSEYYMDANLVSLSQWRSVYYWAKNNGYTDLDAGGGDAAHDPVYNVDWYDCVKWCNARSEQAHLPPVYYTDSTMTTVYRTGNLDAATMNMAAGGYRLPTEAEWEKAARGGIAGQRFPWGDTIDETLANYNGFTGGASYDNGPNGYNALDTSGTSTGSTTPIGTFAANGYGLYDMAGNVSEWCWDWVGTPYGQPSATNPTGPTTGSSRMVRGGNWAVYASFARCAHRGGFTPSGDSTEVGFRSVLSPGPP